MKVLSARELASYCARLSSGHVGVDVVLVDIVLDDKRRNEPAIAVIYTALQQHYLGGES